MKSAPRRHLYDCSCIADLVSSYIKKGGEVIAVKEGVLGYGFMIMLGEGLKTAIVKEIALNEWSSAHTIRMYNKTPKMYQKMITEYKEKENEDREIHNSEP